MDQVPVVDFAPFLTGTTAGKESVACAIGRACEGIGFFYLRNHGVAAGATAGIVAAARRFFLAPPEIKMDPALRITAAHSRGYHPLGARHYANTGAPDLMEAFKYQRELPADEPDIVAGDRIQQSNKWPVGLPGWRDTLVDYFESVDALSTNLLRAFALALDLDEAFFLRYYEKPLPQVSLLHYPPQAPREDAFGNRPHLDATAFTIVLQHQVAGLEVQARSAAWAAVAPLEGTFVINIGNMMARWTNDRFRSTRQRVVNLSGAERFSVPYFAIPDFDAAINCVPTCNGTHHPPKYEPMHVGESIRKKFSGDYIDDKVRS